MHGLRTLLKLALNPLLRRIDLQLSRPSELWKQSTLLGQQPDPGPPGPAREPMLMTFGAIQQTPFDFAVVMPTILRSSITDAIDSILAQDFDGTVQVLVGIDSSVGNPDVIAHACRDMPAGFSVMVLDPGYSTSIRHGGLHPSRDGGSLRTVLTYLANSRRVAYLDDDNWWAPDHLSAMSAALEHADWAWARRWFVHPGSRQPICEDTWESVGPTPSGGWADPNTIAIDKLRCEAILRWWSLPLRNSRLAMDADRRIFEILSTEFFGAPTNKASVFYVINESDDAFAERLGWIGVDRYAASGGTVAACSNNDTANPEATFMTAERLGRRDVSVEESTDLKVRRAEVFSG